MTRSDLGFMALGELVAAVAGEPLDAAVADLVTAPLGMTRTGYNPAAPVIPAGGGPAADAADASCPGAGRTGAGRARDKQAAGSDGFAATERGPEPEPPDVHGTPA